MTIELEQILAKSKLDAEEREEFINEFKAQQKIEKKRMPLRILKEAAIIGSGFYLGFLDGKGTPINPETKYALLAAPTILSIAVSYVALSVVKKAVKKGLKEEKAYLKDRIDKISKISGIKKREFENFLKEISYDDIIMPAIAKRGATTALKTGVSYAMGYGLAKWV